MQMTTREASLYLKVKPETLRILAGQGIITEKQQDGKYYYDFKEMQKLLPLISGLSAKERTPRLIMELL